MGPKAGTYLPLTAQQLKGLCCRLLFTLYKLPVYLVFHSTLRVLHLISEDKGRRTLRISVQHLILQNELDYFPFLSQVDDQFHLLQPFIPSLSISAIQPHLHPKNQHSASLCFIPMSLYHAATSSFSTRVLHLLLSQSAHGCPYSPAQHHSLILQVTEASS